MEIVHLVSPAKHQALVSLHRNLQRRVLTQAHPFLAEEANKEEQGVSYIRTTNRLLKQLCAPHLSKLVRCSLLKVQITPHTSEPGQNSMVATPPCQAFSTCSSHRPKFNS